MKHNKAELVIAMLQPTRIVINQIWQSCQACFSLKIVVLKAGLVTFTLPYILGELNLLTKRWIIKYIGFIFKLSDTSNSVVFPKFVLSHALSSCRPVALVY